jgi:hypothetical protein
VGYGKGTGPAPLVTERYLCSVYNDASNDIVPFDIVNGWMVYRTPTLSYALPEDSAANFVAVNLLAADVPTNVVGAVRLNTMLTATAASAINGFYAGSDHVGLSRGASLEIPNGVTCGSGTGVGFWGSDALQFDLTIDDPSAPAFAAASNEGGGTIERHLAYINGWKPLIPFAHTE